MTRTPRALAFYSFYTINMLILILIYIACRPVWFFIDQTAHHATGLSPLGWSEGILVAYFLAFAWGCLLLTFLYLRKTHPGRAYFIPPALLMLLLNPPIIGLYISLGSGRNIVPRELISMAPWLSLCIILTALIVFGRKLMAQSLYVRIGLATLAVMCVMYLAWFPGFQNPKPEPLLRQTSPDSVSISWASRNKSFGYLLFGTDEDTQQRVYSTHNGLRDANTRYHAISLDNLQPGQEYFYQACTDAIRDFYPNNVDFGDTQCSRIRSFRIQEQGSKKTSFYVFSDVHEKTGLIEKALLEPDYDFVMLNGDIVNNLPDEKVTLNYLFRPAAMLTNGRLPVYYVRGNHETRGAFAREAARFNATPGGKPYYAFRQGPAAIVVLDSGEDKPDGHAEYSGLVAFEPYRQQQAAWLRETVQRPDIKNAPVKIVFTHIPLNFHDAQPDDSPLKKYQTEWVSILDKAGFCAAFSGHTHETTIVPPTAERRFPIVIGGGQAWSDQDNYSIIRCDVIPGGLQVRFITPDGRETGSEKIRARED